jgi:hypothetical protein
MAAAEPETTADEDRNGDGVPNAIVKAQRS